MVKAKGWDIQTPKPLHLNHCTLHIGVPWKNGQFHPVGPSMTYSIQTVTLYVHLCRQQAELLNTPALDGNR